MPDTITFLGVGGLRATGQGCIACREASPTLDILRDRIRTAWTEQDPSSIKKVCRAFRRHLEAVVTAEGGYIEL